MNINNGLGSSAESIPRFVFRFIIFVLMLIGSLSRHAMQRRKIHAKTMRIIKKTNGVVDQNLTVLGGVKPNAQHHGWRVENFKKNPFPANMHDRQTAGPTARGILINATCSVVCGLP